MGDGGLPRAPVPAQHRFAEHDYRGRGGDPPPLSLVSAWVP